MKESFALVVNGRTQEVEAHPDEPLLAVLRNALGLKGTRFGCGHEQCGACMVLLDGEPVYSCTHPAAAAAGTAVATVEGLGEPGLPHPLQDAFLTEQAGQCGYCLSGILMSAKALLARNPQPSRAEIAEALDRHLCRCGAHNRIIRAVARAAAALREGATA